MLEFAKRNYSKVVVVLNESTTMEIGDLKDDDDIDGIIWAGSPGSTGFNALGEILAGTVNPSGKTPDLYSRDFTKDPTFQNFAINGENTYTGVTEISAGVNGSTSAHFVEYEEGIYVGYRYYETRFGSDEASYNANVAYPFGYGLSYTTFSKELVSCEITNNDVTMTVKVTNTGNVAGKEVVQLYYTAPYINGSIEKSSTVLGDFAKTKMLNPGESEIVSITIAKEDMASYDYNDKDNNKFKGYELEKGTYYVQIKDDSHTVPKDSKGNELSVNFTINNTIHLSKKSDDQEDITNKFDNVSGIFKSTKTDGYGFLMSRSNFETTFPTKATGADTKADSITIDGKTIADGLKPYENVSNDEDVQPTVGAKNGLKLIDLRGLDYDDEAYSKILNQLTDNDYDNAGKYLINGAYNTPKMESIDKPATEDHDGPQGFSSLMGKYKYATAYMSEPLLASTFNKDLAKEMRTAIGEEGLAMNPSFSG